MIDLFDDIEENNDQFIGVIEALELVATKTDYYGIDDIARRLILDGFNKAACMFKLNEYGKIELYCSEKGFDDEYVLTTRFLNLAISTEGRFERIETDSYGLEYEHTSDEWESYYWHKSDFFNFFRIKEIGVSEYYYKKKRSLDALALIYSWTAKRDEEKHEHDAKEKAKVITKNFFDEIKEFKEDTQNNEPPFNIESLNAELEQLKLKNEMLKAEIEQLKQAQIQQESDAEIEAAPLVGLDKFNQLAQDRNAMARVMAAYLWKQDEHKNKLPVEIARLVMNEMRNYCDDTDIPQNSESMKKIISSEVPEHARNKRGRPPNKTML